MKKLALFIAFGIFSVTGTVAQNAQHKPGKHRRVMNTEMRAQRHAEQMAKDLDLTTKQKDEVYQLNLMRYARMETMRAERKASQARMAEMRLQNDQELRSILNEKQLSTYHQMQQDKKAKLKENRAKRLGNKNQPAVIKD